MNSKFQLTTIRFLSGPNLKAVLFLAALLIAALAGGAPSDLAGG